MNKEYKDVTIKGFSELVKDIPEDYTIYVNEKGNSYTPMFPYVDVDHDEKRVIISGWI